MKPSFLEFCQLLFFSYPLKLFFVVFSDQQKRSAGKKLSTDETKVWRRELRLPPDHLRPAGGQGRPRQPHEQVNAKSNEGLLGESWGRRGGRVV